MTGWNADTSENLAGIATMTIVEGSSFAVCATTGDILPGQYQGVYFRDTRFVSTWILRVNEQPLECLSATIPKPYRAVFVGRAARQPGHADSPLIVERIRQVGVGLREEIALHNYSAEPIDCTLDLQVATDFADLFEVKGGTVHRTWTQTSTEQDGCSSSTRSGRAPARAQRLRTGGHRHPRSPEFQRDHTGPRPLGDHHRRHPDHRRRIDRERLPRASATARFPCGEAVQGLGIQTAHHLR